MFLNIFKNKKNVFPYVLMSNFQSKYKAKNVYIF